MHRDVTLPRDGHGHEDGAGDGDLVEGVQQVREQDDVRVRGKVEVLAERFQDRAEQVRGVEDGEGNEQKVEAVSHLFAADNDGSDDVPHDAGHAHRGLQHALHPEREVVQEVEVGVVVLGTVQGGVHFFSCV